MAVERLVERLPVAPLVEPLEADRLVVAFRVEPFLPDRSAIRAELYPGTFSRVLVTCLATSVWEEKVKKKKR